MIELFVSAFVTFFVVIDPPGCAPIFAGLTSGASAVHRRAMAIRAVLVASAILFGFALFGEALLRALGISLNAFRIAGGIMLFLIALEMVFEKRTERREDRAEKIKADEAADISIFPMAMPMIAGPGSIASVMLLMSQSSGLASSAVVLAAMASILALTLLALLIAGPIMRVVGAKIEAVVSRLLGVLLAALAAQFVIDGIRASFSAGAALSGH
ncbi:MAG: MarC family protein [Sphingomonas sp.]|uniref:MarC family protein n=1 Tax=Sphingomonas sp. TaxID=28214 RepID=UPI00227624C1|nr:MarC family protein [Sphingomonas sp.]MCX8476119.1 MarC family protein [Sphingomonas sp.]